MRFDRYALWHYRYRWWVAAAVFLMSFFILPHGKGLELENDLNAWFEEDDPYWSTYRQFRDEFGGTRTLIVAVESPELFSRPVLSYIRRLTEGLERLPHVLRVHSLANANQVIGSEDALEVRPLLEGLEERDPEEIRRLALSDRRVRGDLVSEDGTVAAIIANFHDEKADPLRETILAEARRLAEEGRPEAVRLHYNGSMEISQEYNRVSMANMRQYTPPMFLLIVAAIYFLFRSWSRVAMVVVATALSVGWTLGIFGLMGFTYNVISTMIIPLITILAISDDLHLLQRFDESARRSRDRKAAFLDTVSHQLVPVFGASLTTSLGMAALATSKVAAVREFGIATAIGVMVDFVLSFALIPLALTLAPPRRESAPAGERLGRALAAFSRFMAPRSRAVLAVVGVLLVFSATGMSRLRVSTNHIEFFPEENQLHTSAQVIDRKLAGIYSFEIILDGPPDAFKDPALLGRVEALARQVEQLPHIKRALSFVDSLKQVHRELAGGGEQNYRIPETAQAVAQEVFLFGMSEAGRQDLASFLSSDFSRARIWVKMKSTASEEVSKKILQVEKLAAETFQGTPLQVAVTGAGRLFAALDTYLVESQLSSFGTAFVTVFAVIFLIFRSKRYGLLSLIPNLVPVAIVLGLMGWLGITLNIATVMVASIALGIIDDDTIHFIVRYRREIAAGSTLEGAIESSIVYEGGPPS